MSRRDVPSTKLGRLGREVAVTEAAVGREVPAAAADWTEMAAVQVAEDSEVGSWGGRAETEVEAAPLEAVEVRGLAMPCPVVRCIQPRSRSAPPREPTMNQIRTWLRHVQMHPSPESQNQQLVHECHPSGALQMV